MKPLLITTEAGPIIDEAIHPLSPIGGRLAEATELSDLEFIEYFDRVALIPNIFGDAPDCFKLKREYLTRAADNLRPIMRGRRCVIVGIDTAVAFGYETPELYTWERWAECIAAVIPKPNLKLSLAADWRTRDFLIASLLPCIHIEGPDGCGKSTLLPELRFELSQKNLGSTFECIPTQGPPSSYEECLERIAVRIRPGTISDRSSGLVSELVYGPCLRGEMYGPEECYWKIIKSMVQSTTFVYCRPPAEYLDPVFRPDEPKHFEKTVLANLRSLCERYDFVMAKIQSLGGKVVMFDRTSMDPKEIVECVG